MKLLALLLATAGLSGCVAYGAPYGAAPGYYDGPMDRRPSDPRRN